MLITLGSNNFLITLGSNKAKGAVVLVSLTKKHKMHFHLLHTEMAEGLAEDGEHVHHEPGRNYVLIGGIDRKLTTDTNIF